MLVAYRGPVDMQSKYSSNVNTDDHSCLIRLYLYEHVCTVSIWQSCRNVTPRKNVVVISRVVITTR